MLNFIGNKNNLGIASGYPRYEVSVNVCQCLKTTLHASMKEKRIHNDGEEILAHCEKHSNDSVELASLCKLLFFTI